MNRNDRRKTRAQTPKCPSCGERRRPQTRSPIDGQIRCLVCHGQHLSKQVGGPSIADVQTTHQLVVAQQLQEAVHRAIIGVLPERGRVEDDLLVVQALSVTAATFAHHAGLDRQGYCEQAGRHYDQIGDMIRGLMARTAPASPTEPSS